ncbi:hypothetical protein CYMTET_41603 [Cymbomonas tetramitiformis]|uniref:Uncharacterized protein n=1 Tax=Cymbomonas tetramitiformis TaxID=36881 RepID=A0AAE0C5Q9_9CHLO|nr:hypothetical protein CYMTET_41603 [Cymbomonas tetramitiformis]
MPTIGKPDPLAAPHVAGSAKDSKFPSLADSRPDNLQKAIPNTQQREEERPFGNPDRYNIFSNVSNLPKAEPNTQKTSLFGTSENGNTLRKRSNLEAKQKVPQRPEDLKLPPPTASRLGNPDPLEGPPLDSADNQNSLPNGATSSRSDEDNLGLNSLRSIPIVGEEALVGNPDVENVDSIIQEMINQDPENKDVLVGLMNNGKTSDLKTDTKIQYKIEMENKIKEYIRKTDNPVMKAVANTLNCFFTDDEDCLSFLNDENLKPLNEMRKIFKRSEIRLNTTDTKLADIVDIFVEDESVEAWRSSIRYVTSLANKESPIEGETSFSLHVYLLRMIAFTKVLSQCLPVDYNKKNDNELLEEAKKAIDNYRARDAVTNFQSDELDPYTLV